MLLSSERRVCVLTLNSVFPVRLAVTAQFSSGQSHFAGPSQHARLFPGLLIVWVFDSPVPCQHRSSPVDEWMPFVCCSNPRSPFLCALRCRRGLAAPVLSSACFSFSAWGSMLADLTISQNVSAQKLFLRRLPTNHLARERRERGSQGGWSPRKRGRQATIVLFCQIDFEIQ